MSSEQLAVSEYSSEEQVYVHRFPCVVDIYVLYPDESVAVTRLGIQRMIEIMNGFCVLYAIEWSACIFLLFGVICIFFNIPIYSVVVGNLDHVDFVDFLCRCTCSPVTNALHKIKYSWSLSCEDLFMRVMRVCECYNLYSLDGIFCLFLLLKKLQKKV